MVEFREEKNKQRLSIDLCLESLPENYKMFNICRKDVTLSSFIDVTDDDVNGKDYLSFS